jgi:hypothetical protein
VSGEHAILASDFTRKWKLPQLVLYSWAIISKTLLASNLSHQLLELPLEFLTLMEAVATGHGPDRLK